LNLGDLGRPARVGGRCAVERWRASVNRSLTPLRGSFTTIRTLAYLAAVRELRLSVATGVYRLSTSDAQTVHPGGRRPSRSDSRSALLRSRYSVLLEPQDEGPARDPERAGRPGLIAPVLGEGAHDADLLARDVVDESDGGNSLRGRHDQGGRRERRRRQRWR